MAALRAHRADVAARRLQAGSRWQDLDLVFPGPHGAPLHPQSMRDSFRRVCKRAGIGSDWHPHEARHTFVSVLSDAGQPIAAIAAAAGHKNPRITQTVYTHVIAAEIAAAAEVMSDVLGTPPGEPT
jgi:integrase